MTALSDNVYVEMPLSMLTGRSIDQVQRDVLEFRRQQREMNNLVVLRLDETLLQEGKDPWSVNSYRIGTMFAFTSADKVEITYRGETRIIKGRSGE